MVLLYVGLGISLITTQQHIVFDTQSQIVAYVTRFLWLTRTTKTIPFAEISAVYLDYEEQNYYSSKTIYTPQETVEWEKLAARICEMTGKLLVKMPSVPGRAPHTFVDVINQIVQRRLAEVAPTDELSNHTIKLRSHPNGTMEIIVNGTNHKAVDDVPDPAIRALIQQAVEEWQQLVGSSITDMLSMKKTVQIEDII